MAEMVTETAVDVARAVIEHNARHGVTQGTEEGQRRYQDLRAAVLGGREARCRELLRAAADKAEVGAAPQGADPPLRALLDRVRALMDRGEAGEVRE